MGAEQRVAQPPGRLDCNERDFVQANTSLMLKQYDNKSSSKNELMTVKIIPSSSDSESHKYSINIVMIRLTKLFIAACAVIVNEGRCQDWFILSVLITR